MADPITTEDFRRAAKKRLPRMIFDFVDGGAEDEITLSRNRQAFQDIVLRPRSLVDVTSRELTTSVLGETLSLPVIFGPAGLQGLMRRGGECVAARAATQFDTVYCLSSGSSYTLEQVSEAAARPLWFQLYPARDREVTRALVERAKRSGYSVLCLTIDCPVGATRNRDARNHISTPFRLTQRNVTDVLRHPRWIPNAYCSLWTQQGNFSQDSPRRLGVFRVAAWQKRVMNPSATWDEVRWLRTIWPGGLLVKGIMTGSDAERAVDAGADGIIVSNHGGRQLDGTAASIEALPEVVDVVGERADILIDGGIRRGSDVVKALALGARACVIARPYVFSLVLGNDGPRLLLDILRREIDVTLALVGAQSLHELDRSFVEIRSRPQTYVWSHATTPQEISSQ